MCGNEYSYRLFFRALGAPAGLRARVETLAPFEAELLHDAHQIEEMLTRTAEGVMVVVGPAEAQPILPLLLNLRRAVATLPVGPLALEDNVTGEVASDHHDDPIQQGVRAGIAFRVVGESTLARLPKLAGPEENVDFARTRTGGDKAAVPAPLHRLEARSVLHRHHQPAEARVGFAFRFAGEAVRGHELRQAFRADDQRKRKVCVS